MSFMVMVLSLHPRYVIVLCVFASFALSSCKNDSFSEQPENPIVKESKARELYNSFDEKYKKEKPFTYAINKYMDIALEHMGSWNKDIANLDIEKKQDMLLKIASKNRNHLENAKLCSTPEDKFFNDLYFEMIEELNTFDAVDKRVLEGVKMSKGTMEKIDPADMVVSIGGCCYSKLDILYRTENKLLFEHEKVSIKEGDIVCEENNIPGPKRLNRYMGFSIWLKNEIRYRNYDNRCPNISYARSAMREWENAMNNVRKFVEIPDNGWNRFAWGTGTDYHVALSTSSTPNVCVSSVGAVPWAYVHMCANVDEGDFLHELGHTLGLLHEHQRPDRDDYIVINTQNIEDGAQAQFMKIGKVYGPFDFNSIMLYDSYSFAKNKAIATMTKKSDGSKWTEPNVLSTQDKINIKLIYN